jgi:SAM-dependent methyltransferase
VSGPDPAPPVKPMSGADAAAGFDAWAPTYERSALQPTLYVPAQQRALQLAGQLMPRPRRVLDVGCGTGRLLRQARQQYPSAMLVGVDLAWGMVARAAAVTAEELAIRHLRAAADRLPFADRTFDLVVVTMSLRHWTDPAAGIAQVDRVLVLGGVLVVADVLPTRRRRGLHLGVPWRRGDRAGGAPAELAAVLIANRLVVVGCDRMPWFRLPDIHVIAARKPLTPSPPGQSPGGADAPQPPRGYPGCGLPRAGGYGG